MKAGNCGITSRSPRLELTPTRSNPRSSPEPRT